MQENPASQQCDETEITDSNYTLTNPLTYYSKLYHQKHVPIHFFATDTPNSQRVNVEEQRRRDIEEYQKFGAIRKRQHNLPEYQRNVIGPKLPEHQLSSNVEANGKLVVLQLGVLHFMS